MSELKLILVDPKPALCAAWREQFEALSHWEVRAGYFEEVSEFDCMVSAANSFGLMDGGVDLAIVRYFGRELEQSVQQRILTDYLGEQPVGTSFIVETGHPVHPFLAHTPTMRAPMEIARTDNVYLAMWAMLLAIHTYNRNSEYKIKTVLCPGLGTGTGAVPPREAARQMALAYRNFLRPPAHIGWRYASQRQDDVRYGGDLGFRFDPSLRWEEKA